MKIAILHYHLNRGGVTQVALNHLRALRLAGRGLQLSEVLVLHGGRADGWKEVDAGVPVHVESVSGLDYDPVDELNVERLTSAIEGVLGRFGFHSDDTILHAHNHSLGKNLSLPNALWRLADRGYRLLLQIHDFAEDLRPANFRRLSQLSEAADRLYPAAAHIHYALLNSRDRDIVLKTDVDPEQVHLLPNPVTATSVLPPHDESREKFCAVYGLPASSRIVLYPVRGIRRKNLGELLLWSAIADEDTYFALTLPATSDVEVPAFDRWKGLARRLDLRVLFDVGLSDDLSFEENVAAASRIITTSVAEGFGLTFLESWLHDRLLIGRNLPEITRDFADRGVRLDHLGESLRIPVDWIGGELFVEQIMSLHAELCAAYGHAFDSGTERVLREQVGNSIDFAALTTQQQVAVIERAARDRDEAATIFEFNPWLRGSLDADDDSWRSLIESNAAAVCSAFSLESAASDLAKMYTTLLASPISDVSSIPHPENILKAFLDVRRLCPVRIEP